MPINNIDEIVLKAKSLRLKPDLVNHPWEHTERVQRYAAMIAEKEFPDIVIHAQVSAAYHDIGRELDRYDPDHARVGAGMFFKESGLISAEYRPESIIFAIKHHSDRAAPNGGLPVIGNYIIPSGVDPRIAMCLWDADRLDLVRLECCGMVLPELLSTKTAKEFANTREHQSIYLL